MWLAGQLQIGGLPGERGFSFEWVFGFGKLLFGLAFGCFPGRWRREGRRALVVLRAVRLAVVTREKERFVLFVLTGDIQTGKTRWLAGVLEELERDGVPCAGVLAPGIWRECGFGAAEDGMPVAVGGEAGAPAEVGGESAASTAPRFEKLGIENVLLPQGEHLLFALRRDLATQDETGRSIVDSDATRLLEEAARERLVAGAPVAGGAEAVGGMGGVVAGGAKVANGNGPAAGAASQSAAAKLGWAIADDAIDRVNAHFDELSQGIAQLGTPSLADAAASEPAGLLVVDELGQLELLRGRGLVSAVSLLQAGPSARFPHALVIVREWLLDKAEESFFGAWPERAIVTADDDARCALRQAFGLGC